MIVDEHGLLWRQKSHDVELRYGGECVVRVCQLHPRVTQMVQRANRKADWVTTFHVDGIAAQHWHTAAEAIAAARENPCS